MSRFIVAAAVLASVATEAAAQPRHDTSLEKAAAAIVARKMGEIRGSFDFDTMPEFVRPIDWRPREWRTGAGSQPVASIVGASLR